MEVYLVSSTGSRFPLPKSRVKQCGYFKAREEFQQALEGEEERVIAVPFTNFNDTVVSTYIHSFHQSLESTILDAISIGLFLDDRFRVFELVKHFERMLEGTTGSRHPDEAFTIACFALERLQQTDYLTTTLWRKVLKRLCISAGRYLQTHEDFSTIQHFDLSTLDIDPATCSYLWEVLVQFRDIQFFCEHGLPIEHMDARLLSYKCYDECVQFLEYYYDRCGHVDTVSPTTKMTMLGLSITQKQWKVTEFLLDRGASPDLLQGFSSFHLQESLQGITLELKARLFPVMLSHQSLIQAFLTADTARCEEIHPYIRMCGMFSKYAIQHLSMDDTVSDEDLILCLEHLPLEQTISALGSCIKEGQRLSVTHDFFRRAVTFISEEGGNWSFLGNYTPKEIMSACENTFYEPLYFQSLRCTLSCVRKVDDCVCVLGLVSSDTMFSVVQQILGTLRHSETHCLYTLSTIYSHLAGYMDMYSNTRDAIRARFYTKSGKLRARMKELPFDFIDCLPEQLQSRKRARKMSARDPLRFT